MKVIRERDNLGKQLLRRNNECALLYEKIKIQQSILNKGDFHYNQRVKDINLLKLELKRLRRKKSILDSTSSNTEDLRYTALALKFSHKKDLVVEHWKWLASKSRMKGRIFYTSSDLYFSSFRLQ